MSRAVIGNASGGRAAAANGLACAQLPELQKIGGVPNQLNRCLAASRSARRSDGDSNTEYG